MRSASPPEGPDGPRLSIADLRQAPRAAAVVARWLHDEWYAFRADPGGAHGSITPEALQDRLLGGAGDAARRIPATFVACLGGEPAGTFTLEPTSDPRSGLPLLCLSNVYVAPRWRGRGLGARLCDAAVDRTRVLRIPRLSLFTVSHAAYYAALGWRSVDVAPMASRGSDALAMLMQRAVDLAPTRRASPARARQAVNLLPA